MRDQMVEAVEGDLKPVVFRVVDNPDQRQPFRFDLVAKRERGDFDLGPFADHRLRDTFEIRVPFGFFELAYHHDHLRLWFGCRYAVGHHRTRDHRSDRRRLALTTVKSGLAPMLTPAVVISSAAAIRRPRLACRASGAAGCATR